MADMARAIEDIQVTSRAPIRIMNFGNIATDFEELTGYLPTALMRNHRALLVRGEEVYRT